MIDRLWMSTSTASVNISFILVLSLIDQNERISISFNLSLLYLRYIVTYIANIDFLIGRKLVYWKFTRYTIKLFLSSIPMYVSSAYKTVF